MRRLLERHLNFDAVINSGWRNRGSGRNLLLCAVWSGAPCLSVFAVMKYSDQCSLREKVVLCFVFFSGSQFKLSPHIHNWEVKSREHRLLFSSLLCLCSAGSQPGSGAAHSGPVLTSQCTQSRPSVQACPVPISQANPESAKLTIDTNHHVNSTRCPSQDEISWNSTQTCGSSS